LIKIAIFCSGSGSNAEALMAHFKDHKKIQIALLITNKEDSFARKRAEKFGIPELFFPRKVFSTSPEIVLRTLDEKQVSFVLLAGFLQLVHPSIVAHFPNRILNIHPALLPDFGGEGMYGHHVHEAVKKSGTKITGLSIHVVNSEYDKGKIIFQARCPVEIDDSPDDIAARVLRMEHRHYPLIAEYFIQNSSGNLPLSA
jgi:phosphoribosylglycinamide formyltransferase-1